MVLKKLKKLRKSLDKFSQLWYNILVNKRKGKTKMKVFKTVELEMTEEEKKAIKTVFRMLYDLVLEDEQALANELGYNDLEPIRTDLANLYELGGGNADTDL